MILDRRPGTKIQFSAYRGPRLPQDEFWVGVTGDSNPWDDIQDVARLMSMHLFFNGNTCHMGYAVA